MVQSRGLINSSISKMNATKENQFGSSINVKKIAITVFHGRVVSRLESAKHLLLVAIEDEKIKNQQVEERLKWFISEVASNPELLKKFNEFG